MPTPFRPWCQHPPYPRTTGPALIAAAVGSRSQPAARLSRIAAASAPIQHPQRPSGLTPPDVSPTVLLVLRQTQPLPTPKPYPHSKSASHHISSSQPPQEQRDDLTISESVSQKVEAQNPSVIVPLTSRRLPGDYRWPGYMNGLGAQPPTATQEEQRGARAAFTQELPLKSDLTETAAKAQPQAGGGSNSNSSSSSPKDALKLEVGILGQAQVISDR